MILSSEVVTFSGATWGGGGDRKGEIGPSEFLLYRKIQQYFSLQE